MERYTEGLIHHDRGPLPGTVLWFIAPRFSNLLPIPFTDLGASCQSYVISIVPHSTALDSGCVPVRPLSITPWMCEGPPHGPSAGVELTGDPSFIPQASSPAPSGVPRCFPGTKTKESAAATKTTSLSYMCKQGNRGPKASVDRLRLGSRPRF